MCTIAKYGPMISIIFPSQVRQQCRPDGGALLPPQPPSVDNALLLAVQALPKTGSKKAKLLLSKFESKWDDSK